MKWYASYTGVGEYSLYSEKEYNELFEELRQLEAEDNVDVKNEFMQLKTMIEFNNFSKAKKYIEEGIKCDVSDLKIALYRLKKERAYK
jgi:hypothetical protein